MLFNFPLNTNKNIWRDHSNICNLLGKFYFLYYEQLPRIGYVIDGSQNECINYFLNKALFSKPPQWIIISNNLVEKIFKYKEGEYKIYHDNLDWDEIKHLEPIEITKYCAEKVVKKIYDDNKKWLNNSKSKRAIQAIPRIFAEPTALIYELVQNAFDANATKVKIELNKKNLRFYHDGYNFTESDVSSISFINLSNKDKDKVGFMGIGFKSAFEATEKPEIHSHPFSFLFNNSVDGGFILPQNTKPKQIRNFYTTLICVPFKNQNIYELINRELIPEEQINEGVGFSRKTFLHLLKENNNKLSGITEVETPYVKFNITKGEIPYTYKINDITNEEKSKSEIWLRLEKQFKPNQTQIADFLASRIIKNEELEKVGWEEIISIIIPLTKKGFVYSPDTEYNGILNVYLPTKIKTGLNCDIQGNFIVDATRKNIKNIQGEWNKELFSNISNLLIDIFKWCKSFSNPELINLPNFYSLIPEWDKIEFIPKNILENIKSNFIRLFNSNQLIPIETNSSRKIHYKYPHECIIVDNVILDLFRKKTIEKLSKKKVVLKDLNKEVRQKILNSSNLSKWGIEETIIFLSENKWVQYLPKFKNQQQCNRWLSKLYAYLKRILPKCIYSDTYRDLKNKILMCYIFPIEWSNVERKYRFTRFLFRKKKLYRFPREKAKLPLEAFQHKINVLNQAFENYIRGRTGGLTEEERQIIEDSRNLLEKVSIPILEPTTIIKDFIIPLFEKVTEYDKDTLIDYTSFICNHLTEVKKENIKIDILLLNKKGEFCNPSDLFFGEEYGFSNIREFFGNSKDEIFLSEQYLEKKSISTNDWVALFLYIEVDVHLPCKTVKEKLHLAQLRERIGNEIYLPCTRVTWINQDFPGNMYLVLDADFSDVVKARLEEIKVLPSKLKRDSMRAFLKILDQYWDKEYSTNIFINVKYYGYGQWGDSSPRQETTNMHTKFAEYLLNEDWVPATNFDNLKNPKEVAALTEENIFLSDGGVILCEEIINNQNLLKFLPFKPLPENITNLHRLINLKNRDVTNMEKYKKIYSLIYSDIQNEILRESDVRSEFIENKLIFANNNFWSPKEVIYSLPSQLQLWLPRLNEIYPDLEFFFCDILGCPKEEPNIEHILQYFLNFVWKTEKGMSDEFRATILYGYRKILDFITDKENKDFLEIRLWQKFITEAKVFCKKVGWVEIKSTKAIIYIDNVKYEKSYSNSDKIYVESHLSQLKKDTDDLLPLLNFFNILPISKNTEEKFEILGESEIYPNIDRIETNIGLLIDNMIKVLESKGEDLTPREKNKTKKFTQIINEFRSKRMVIYRVSDIKTTIYLNDEELFSINKSCHIENTSQQVKIFITDDIRTIYGAFKDELITEFQLSILSGQLRELVQNMVTNTIANIEDNFNKSIDSFLIENGFKSRKEIEDSSEKEKESNIRETKLEEKVKENGDEGGFSTEKEEKKSYDKIVEKIDYDNVNFKTIDEHDLDYRNNAEKEKDVTKRGRGKGFYHHNPYSTEDGMRGEKVALKKEKDRLKEIGLDSYIPKIYHISKDIPGNPWDIESFDKNEKTGEVVPIRIEVKATPDPQNLTFPMSEPEFRAALEENHPKGRYFIYRVFNVRSATPDIKTFDFSELFSKKLINFKSKDFYIELIVKENKEIEDIDSSNMNNDCQT